MTLEEAVNELVQNAYFRLNDIEQHEEFADQETDEGQLYFYEGNKKELEAYCIVLGKIDPELSTRDGIRERYNKVFGGSEEKPGPTPEEVELCSILNGKEDLELTSEENKELAKINKDTGFKKVVIGDDPEACPNPSEDDMFVFYSYRGRVAVIYNDYADCNFSDDFSPEFQKKALEIIKNYK